MIELNLTKDNKKEPILKFNYDNLNEKQIKFIKRILMEGKKINENINKGFKYQIPLKYFSVLVKNFDKEQILIDKESELSFIEFSDIYDEKYYYTFDIDAKYMKKWREEKCPNIYKIEIDKDTLNIKDEIIFKKISRIDIM